MMKKISQGTAGLDHAVIRNFVLIDNKPSVDVLQEKSAAALFSAILLHTCVWALKTILISNDL